MEIVVEVPWETIIEPLASETHVEEIKEKEIIPVDPGDFMVDENDSNLFYSLKNKDFSIRIVKGQLHKKERSKDQLVFATSLPHKFNSFTFKAMQNYVPQLTNVDFSKSHELLITKSAASKFDDLQNSIMRFIFLLLDRDYSWLNEEQTVLISLSPNRDILSFDLRVQTCNHLELGIAMFEISGITNQLASEPFPLCMNHKNNYNFNLKKGKAFSWEELLPKIKEVFKSHFTAGVKFTGYMN